MDRPGDVAVATEEAGESGDGSVDVSKTTETPGVVAEVVNGEGAASDDDLVQYVVLRRDLADSWPKGAFTAQACHASLAAIWKFRDHPQVQRYLDGSGNQFDGDHSINDMMRKVVLGVRGETQLINLSAKLEKDQVLHKLWYELPEKIPTCLATIPSRRGDVGKLFRKLQLLR